MDAQFWINAWNEGRTNFHQSGYHKKLTEYFPTFHPIQGQTVLVPLCGKSKDLLFLHGLGFKVQGVELFEQAVKDFFKENELSPYSKSHHLGFERYSYEKIVISCGDFFQLEVSQEYDFVYDRASLVALPVEMRKTYSEVIKRALKPGGRCLLIAYEYDQTKFQGPPFSVSAEEIQDLYQDQFSVKFLESAPAVKQGFSQTVYELEKNL